MLRDECQKNDQMTAACDHAAFVDFLSTAFNKATTNIHHVCLLQMQSMFGLRSAVFYCKACEFDSH